jgi:uncharacterized membrane protein
MTSVAFWLMAAVNLLWSSAHLLPDRYTSLVTFAGMTLWLTFKRINRRRVSTGVWGRGRSLRDEWKQRRNLREFVGLS